MGDRFAMPPTLPPELARSMLAHAQRLAGPERDDGAGVDDHRRRLQAAGGVDPPARYRAVGPESVRGKFGDERHGDGNSRRPQ